MHSTYASELKSVPDIFNEVVMRFPENIALLCNGSKITYRTLNMQATALAAVLQYNGLKKGDVIALKMKRGSELYIFMLALLKIGAVIVPVSTNSPQIYISEIIVAAAARCLIGDDSEPRLAGAWHNLSSEALLQAATIQTAMGDFPALSAEDPAIMLMTSGSTGKPKSVLIPHRGIARLSLPVAELGNSEKDRYLQIADISFAASANEIWMSLLTGATLVIAPPGLPDLMALSRQIATDGITILFLSGGLFRLFVEVVVDALHVTDSVVVSGDFVNPRLFVSAANAGKAKIFNGLGCTENSAISSLYRVHAGDNPPDEYSIPVGSPLPLVDMVVLNEALQPCSCAEPGELFIAGAGLALGYSDATLTKARFIPVLYQGREVRFYRTDDQAIYDKKHNIVLTGRGSHICKIRGFRVNITGIEHVLRLHPALDDILVVLEETQDEPRLHACYVTKDASLSVAELTHYLSLHLPAWMIPEKFSRLATLPMTTNGKKDRLQLKKYLLEQV